MAKSNDLMGSDSNHLEKKVSVLTSLTDKSLKNPARLGLIGSLIWIALMLFYFINDFLAKPLESYSAFVVSDILNIIGAFLLFLFIRFLYKQGIHFGSKNLIFMILTGFALRVAGKILDAGNYALIDFQVGSDALIAGIFLLSDLFHLLGALAITALMLIFFKKEQKRSYKVICFLNVVFALLYAFVYIFLFLLDAGIIESVYIQLTRLISLFTSITLILYFSILLKDSRKMERKADNNLDI